MQHTFWYISLPSLHDYDVKVPSFEDVNKQRRKFLTLSELEYVS